MSNTTCMTLGSLFAGIGGLDLGFERAGFEVRWQVENNDYCNRILTKHWPNVRRYKDVREVGDELEKVDVICGGFPCQDISEIGTKKGITGERSGLWTEMSRIIRVVRPQFVVVENVSALRKRGLGRVLGDLAQSGYDAEWGCISAASLGAPHIRERVFILAYPTGFRCERLELYNSSKAKTKKTLFNISCGDKSIWNSWWNVESNVGRMAYGFPTRMDRVQALGNAVVPQVARIIAQIVLTLNKGNVGIENENKS